MKKLLTGIIFLLSFVGIGFGVFVYSNPLAHENLGQLSTKALAGETVENYMRVEKEGLALNLKSVADAYERLKDSSNARIDDLKFSLLILVILLCVTVGYIVSLLFRLKKQHVTRV